MIGAGEATTAAADPVRPGAAALPFRPIALAYRAVGVVLIAIGIARVTGLFTGDPSWSSFTYYTVQSNGLCLVWMLLSGAVAVRDIAHDGRRGFSTPSARLAGAVMIAITVTMLVYLLVLVPTLYVQPGAYEPFTLTDNLIHIVTPVLAIADWLLFVPKPRFRAWDPLLWALIPLAYVVFAFCYGALGGEFAPGVRYPYPFLDLDVNGAGGVTLWIVGLTAAGVALGYAYLGIDRLAGRAFARR